MSTLIDITGQRFGRWIVLYRGPNAPRSRTRWVCRCDCGQERMVDATHLRSGRSVSCGCLTREATSAALRLDLAGQRFGRLTAIEHGPNDGVRVQWVCRCGCGQEVLVSTNSLRTGNTRSCGCLRRDLLTSVRGDQHRNWAEVPTYHGMHIRVRRVRGKASEYTCVDCGGPAEDWSWVHGCPDAVEQNINGYTVTYCAHLDCFAPRDKKCHRRYDAA